MTDSEDLLSVTDFLLVQQSCTEVTVAFDDMAVADFFEDQIDEGRRPEQFGRIWIHTHPGSSPQPSSVDVETFGRVFGSCDWAVMFIIAKGGASFAELSWRNGGPTALRMNIKVDYSRPFAATNHEQWQAEYADCVQDQTKFDEPKPHTSEEWLFDVWDEPESTFDRLAHPTYR